MATTPEEEQTLFYALLGQAVEHWSHVEDALCDVFLAALGIFDDGEHSPGSAAYYAVVSFEARLAMVHAAVSTAFPDWTKVPDWPHDPDPRRVTWGALHNRCRGKAKMRNKLAHLQAYQVKDGKEGHRFELRPRRSDPKTIVKYDDKNLPRYRINELRTAVNEFSILARDLTDFIYTIQ